jgi:glycosyltransferase involved in cell wall biosynthesis
MFRGRKLNIDPRSVFSEDWYRAENPDLAELVLDPFMHFMELGWAEGRNPHPLFDTKFYFESNPDVDKAGVNPLLHYLQQGWREGRSPHPLFDARWYLETYSDVACAGVEPLTHYLSFGQAERRSPHPLFDPDWYGDTPQSQSGSLVHYLTVGWREGRNPYPLFDTDWYLTHSNSSSIAPHLVDFIVSNQQVSPHPLFDTKWYYDTYPDVAAAKVNALLHFVTIGWREGRKPNPWFDTKRYVEAVPELLFASENPLAHYLKSGPRSKINPSTEFDREFYLAQYPDVAEAGLDPLVHFLMAGLAEGRAPISQEPSGVSMDAIMPSPASQKLVSNRDVHRELSGLPRPSSLGARGIAFYLPQFHSIPENNEWWGDGFTEWTNVTRAKPQYEDHQQPTRPGELGYYDLEHQPHIMRRQAALAYQYGLEAFCFYFYWFGGKRLLEAPIKSYAEDDAIQFPFCLCWANEPWSRTWDGREQELLIGQQHSPDDDLAFIAYVSAYMRNPKYLRVLGRPLLIVYRPGLLPDAKATTARWRAWCRDNGVGEIYLVCTQSFDTIDPESLGFDAATEFPPNNMGLEPQDGMVVPIADGYQCKVYDWSVMVARSENYREVPYKLFRGVTPRWDNTARRMNRGTIFVNSNTDMYLRWLRNAVADAKRKFEEPSERLVFLNAWNEWAEGAHLEPDHNFGYAWLEATRLGLQSEEVPNPVEPSALVHDLVPTERERPKIVVVVHDLHPHGAQFLSLNLVSSLYHDFGYEVLTVACGSGKLLERFAMYGDIIGVDKSVESSADVREILCGLVAKGFRKAIVNSSASGWIASHLAEVGIECIGLVHELPDIVRSMQLEGGLVALNEHARSVVFASGQVRDRTAFEVLGRPWANPVVQPQGLYKRDGVVRFEDKEAARLKLCEDLSVPTSAFFVLGVGYGDRRKGVDVFCRWAIAAASADLNRHFVWVGALCPVMEQVCQELLGASGKLASNIHFVGFQNDTGRFYKAASIFALTSREDPYPSTAIEAMDAGVPVVMVAGTGGISDLESTGAVSVLSDESEERFIELLAGFQNSRDKLKAVGDISINLARAKFGFKSFVGDMLRLLGEPIPKVSVVLPNYNYAKYLPHRLSSILNQSLPVWEIIFLDDFSTDDSLHTAEAILQNCGVNYRILANERNSGSVFSQWQTGVVNAEGDLVWIAEADDWAGREFLRVAAGAFADKQVVLSYTQSHQVNGESEILAASYLDYVADVDQGRWRRPFVADGAYELEHGLSVKNTIPNVSAVVFRKDSLLNVLTTYLNEIKSYRVAGDWCAYSILALFGKFSYDPRPLNYHRRHASSVTVSGFSRADWNEIRRMQAFVAGMINVDHSMKSRAKRYIDELAKRLE